MKKLIIWDFDGVISPTEDLWISVWIEHISEKYGLKLSSDEWDAVLRGVAPHEKCRRLHEKHNILIESEEIEEILAKEEDAMDDGLVLTPNVLNIFENKAFKQCVATGGHNSGSTKKVCVLGLDKYFSIDKNTLFTAEMVSKGKPDPEMFLLAAKTVGYTPSECFVIEDSKAGIEAGIAAGMDVIGYTEYSKDKKQSSEMMLEKGAVAVFDNMIDLSNYINN